MTSSACQRAHRRGFALLEVLITWAVLTCGVLGISTLFARSLAVGRSALLHTLAESLAADLGDSVRANAAGEARELPTTEVDRCSLAAQEALPAASECVARIAPHASGEVEHFHIELAWAEPPAGSAASVTTDVVVVPGAGAAP